MPGAAGFKEIEEDEEEGRGGGGGGGGGGRQRRRGGKAQEERRKRAEHKQPLLLESLRSAANDRMVERSMAKNEEAGRMLGVAAGTLCAKERPKKERVSYVSIFVAVFTRSSHEPLA